MSVRTHRLFTLVAACLMGLLLSTTVQAKGSKFGFFPGSSYKASSYIGLDGSSLSLNNTVDDDANPRGLRVRLGVRMNRLFDLEAQFGGGSDKTVQAFDELSASYMGLYLKGYLPVGFRSAAFALGGLSAVELSQTTGRGTFVDDRRAVSYGFGLETQLTRRLDLSADFMRYVINDTEYSSISAFNMGVKFYF